MKKIQFTLKSENILGTLNEDRRTFYCCRRHQIAVRAISLKLFQEVQILSEYAVILDYTCIACLVVDKQNMKNVLGGNFLGSFHFVTPKLCVYKLSSIVYIIINITTETSIIKVASSIATTFWGRLFSVDHYSKRMQ